MSMKNYGVEGYGVNLCELQFKDNRYNAEHLDYNCEALEELVEELSRDSVYLDYETACLSDSGAVYLMLCPHYPWYETQGLPQTQEDVLQLIWKTLKDYVDMTMEEVFSYANYISDSYCG